MVFVSPWCGCLKGRHYRALGSGFGPQYLYSGDTGGHFGTLGVILVTQEAPKQTLWSQSLFFVILFLFGVSWEPLWSHVGDFSEFCGVKAGG